MNQEDFLLRKKSFGNERLTEDEQVIWDKFVKSYTKEKPTLDDFKILYKSNFRNIKNIIERDKYSVEEHKNREGMKDVTERSQIFEAICFKIIEEQDWFGENCFVSSTTEFDDRINGVDLVLEWDDGGKPLRIAVDCTVGDDMGTIEKKVKRILTEIQSGRMAKVKYFQSENNPESYGPIEGLLKVILHVKKEQLEQLCKDINNGSKIDKNYLQLYLLDSIFKQLSVFEDLLVENKVTIENHGKGDKKQEIIEKLEKAQVFINGIIEDKADTKNKNSLDDAAVQRAIKEIEKGLLSKFLSSPSSLY